MTSLVTFRIGWTLRSKSLVDPERRRLVRALSRPALHARRLVFTHPGSGQRMAFVSAWSDDFEQLWVGLGGTRP